MVPFWESMFCPPLVTATVSTPCNSAPALHAAFAEARGRRDGIGGTTLKSAALVSTVAAALICKQPKRSRARKTVCFASELARSGSGSGSLKIDGAYFVDEEGRIVLPRGINFSGLSKVPTHPDGATHLGGPIFYQHRDVSFVGRPCSLEKLDLHLQRLKDWGFNLLRLVITWEAVEHAGPGNYDQDYLNFLRKVCLRAGDFGFWVIIDPHQDCWSRWTGGDGAPGWTLEAPWSWRN